jgi:hypothetical protein
MAVTWRCPVPQCEFTATHRGHCKVHREQLQAVPDQTDKITPAPGSGSGSPHGAAAAPGAAPSAAAADSADPPRRIRLILAGVPVPVPAEGMVIGRAVPPWRDEPKVQALTQISRTQARVFWRGRTLQIEDAGSRNGTFIEDRRVSKAVPLQPGAHLRFGLDVDVTVVEVDEFGMAIEQED